MTANVFTGDSRIDEDGTTHISIVNNTFERGGIATLGGTVEHFETMSSRRTTQSADGRYTWSPGPTAPR